MKYWDGHYAKDLYWGCKRGHTILDVKCFCGKLLFEWQDYANHMRAKHSKLIRKLKKSGQWQQDKIDWKVRPIGSSSGKVT